MPIAIGVSAALTLVVAGCTAIMIIAWFGWFGGMSVLPIPIWFPRFWLVCWGIISAVAVPLFFDIRNARVGTVTEHIVVPALLTSLTTLFLGPVSIIGILAAAILGYLEVRRDRFEEWQCGVCGYDMRASPPGACPECGWGQRR